MKNNSTKELKSKQEKKKMVCTQSRLLPLMQMSFQFIFRYEQFKVVLEQPIVIEATREVSGMNHNEHGVNARFR